MKLRFTPPFRARARTPIRLAAGAALALVAACGGRPETGINDPYEARNRRVHEANKQIDTALFGNPERNGVVPEIPEPVARGLGNVSDNLGAPGNVVNGLLQGNPETVVVNTFRFVINTTVGIGGLFDPASAIGLPEDETDFGETLYVWGVPEGVYMELPVLGPSTERDLAGRIVDFALDPVGRVLDAPEIDYARAARVGGAIGSRQRFANTFESVLYGSADSYAQARLLYLQNRRFELGQETEEEEIFDPYGDPYAE